MESKVVYSLCIPCARTAIDPIACNPTKASTTNRCNATSLQKLQSHIEQVVVMLLGRYVLFTNNQNV